ncbi:glycerate kinase [Kiritimatiellaeota bacterium B1221]|nr:glycerate kinase [Kiritimatiellaeota bacterium B1221]
MKILLCMDSWKGSLSAIEACEAVAKGIRSVQSDAKCDFAPMADGGEGTQELFEVLRPGSKVLKTVQGPLAGMRVDDGYLFWPEAGEALIEMARCSGLPLLTEKEKNPMWTTTFGVGEWIADTVERGCRQITLAVGGSATVDGGMGMAQALGWRFLDAEGKELGFGGGALRRLHRIMPPANQPDLKMRVMCDVTNPLLGEKGSAAVFGPQKGADAQMVEDLEAGLTRLAECIERDLGMDVRTLPGGGAAGGIAAGAVAFFGAELVSGVDEMMRIADLPAKIAQADWVITGEGRVDSQSLDGKVLSGILKSAADTPVAVIAGSCLLRDEDLQSAGLAAALSANDQRLPLEEALARAGELAENAGKRFAETCL